MEPVKKKSKKSFLVPVAKADASQEARNKDGRKLTELDKEDKPKKNVKTERLETKAKKQMAKVDKPNVEKDVGKVKVQRSLTDKQYDDLFMSVLQSVMKAEQLGDEPDHKEQVEPDDDDDDNDDETESQVIEVTVKVEELEQTENFDTMVNEDIDQWDCGGTMSEKKCNKNYGCSKEVNLVGQSGMENSTEPDSKVQKTVSASSSLGKQKQTKKSVKLKEKSSWKKPELPSSTSGSVRSKKRNFSVPSEQEKKCKKMSKGPTSSKEKSNTQAKPKPGNHIEKKSLKQMMLERELEDLGTWVQCGNTSCLKWRYLTNVTDPMDIPRRWECSMNANEACNRCDQPEEDYDEAEHIYTKYTEGSVVLAKLAGYPWWPGMIEIDPDYDTYFEVAVPASMYPTKYHVVFFDKNVSRAWVSIASIKPFEEIDALPRKCKGHDYKREVNAAVKNAKDALELPIKERLKKFSFGTRFSGKWGYFGDKSEHKKVKAKSSTQGRHSKKRKLDEGREEHLVDDETLDQILNNSQSVFSDVVEMLSSIENATLDSQEDPEFELDQQCKKTKKSPMLQGKPVEKNECPPLNAAGASDEENTMENAVKFEVAELDKDIFTMELDSIPMGELDMQETVDRNSHINLQLIDMVKDTQNRQLKGEISDQTVEGATSSSEKKQKLKKKKLKETCESSVYKEEIVRKKKKAVEGIEEKAQNEEVSVKKTAKSKKKKDTETEVICETEAKSAGIKKKKKDKEETDCATTKGPDKKVNDNAKGSKSDEEEQEKKTKKKKKSKVENYGEVKANDETLDVKMLDACSYTKSEVYVEKKKRAKELSQQKEKPECEKSVSATERSDDVSRSEKQKKVKSKFMNPTHVQAADKKDSSSQKKKKEDKVPEEATSKTRKQSKDDNSSQKGKTKRKKTKPEKVKGKGRDEQNESGDELDLSFDTADKDVVGAGEDSDEEFILDLNDTVNKKRRQAEPLTVNGGDDDSEPLDFEE